MLCLYAKILPIQIPKHELAEFCQRHHICKLALFGSVLREDSMPESDVDWLVEFEPGKVSGYIRLASMEACEIVADETRTSLDSDRKLSLALMRLIEIVGEAAERVSKDQ
ncbi:MAG: nucleotidyltransferase domain-containing protein [Phormidesmis sp. CAN_BIN44]|nr:nucleotidyltransferase domain-containing protein [Phormidesmis sp. CAN_BIN44]